MSDDNTKFWDKFENDGEDRVRKNLNLGLYGEGKRRYAKAWIEEKRQQRLSESGDRDDAFKREQIEIARDAADAAWEAARAARTAATIAKFALVVAIIIPIIAGIGRIA